MRYFTQNLWLALKPTLNESDLTCSFRINLEACLKVEPIQTLVNNKSLDRAPEYYIDTLIEIKRPVLKKIAALKRRSRQAVPMRKEVLDSAEVAFLISHVKKIDDPGLSQEMTKLWFPNAKVEGGPLFTLLLTVEFVTAIWTQAALLMLFNDHYRRFGDVDNFIEPYLQMVRGYCHMMTRKVAAQLASESRDPDEKILGMTYDVILEDEDMIEIERLKEKFKNSVAQLNIDQLKGWYEKFLTLMAKYDAGVEDVLIRSKS